jgi:hypothetical protein
MPGRRSPAGAGLRLAAIGTMTALLFTACVPFATAGARRTENRDRTAALTST